MRYMHFMQDVAFLNFAEISSSVSCRTQPATAMHDNALGYNNFHVIHKDAWEHQVQNWEKANKDWV